MFVGFSRNFRDLFLSFFGEFIKMLTYLIFNTCAKTTVVNIMLQLTEKLYPAHEISNNEGVFLEIETLCFRIKPY